MVRDAKILDNANRRGNRPAPDGVKGSRVTLLVVVLAVWIVGSLPLGLVVGLFLSEAGPSVPSETGGSARHPASQAA